ncbi:MAG: radical SAM protein [Elusimicrobiaceae bacterium]|nr:radical SAM protein [Elusimicrobiaceae bacterium]
MTTDLKYIYGPVPSWRLGKSLGVDVLSQPAKVCNFDCIYCQLGKTGYCPAQRKEFVAAGELVKELAGLPDTAIDYITFSGRGEATLAANLRETLEGVKKLRKEPVAIITNAVLLNDADIRRELSGFDFVVAKLDACNEEMLSDINRPLNKVKLSEILDGFCVFRKQYRGKLAVQTMLIKQNAGFVEMFADIYRRIAPDEIQLNTPLRPSSVEPLGAAEIAEAAKRLKIRLPDIPIKTVYDSEKPRVQPLSGPETLKRRGKI